MKRLGSILLLLAVGLFGCDGSSTTATEESDAPPMVTVGHVGHDHQLALYVAGMAGESLGDTFLREVKSREVYDLCDDGVVLARLRLIKVGGGSKMPAAMERREIQIGLGGVPAVAKFADKGKPFKIICPLQCDGDMLVMRADSPVNDWASFIKACRSDGPPMRIGYKAPMAVAKLVFVGALGAEGVPNTNQTPTESDRVILVNMGGGKKAVPLLESGVIDGFVMNQPVVAMAAAKGVGKVVANLRDLPPVGKWANHPCCCVAATERTLAEHPRVIKAFLKAILLASARIRTDPEYGVDVAAEWIRNPHAVEAASVPTVVYLGEPTGKWMSGMVTWLELMQNASGFTGKYAEASAAEFVADVCSLDLCREAAEELRKAKALGKRQP